MGRFGSLDDESVWLKLCLRPRLTLDLFEELLDGLHLAV